MSEFFDELLESVWQMDAILKGEREAAVTTAQKLELDARYANYKAGCVETVDASEAIKKIRTKLGWACFLTKLASSKHSIAKYFKEKPMAELKPYPKYKDSGVEWLG